MEVFYVISFIYTNNPYDMEQGRRERRKGGPPRPRRAAHKPV